MTVGHAWPVYSKRILILSFTTFISAIYVILAIRSARSFWINSAAMSLKFTALYNLLKILQG